MNAKSVEMVDFWENNIDTFGAANTQYMRRYLCAEYRISSTKIRITA